MNWLRNMAIAIDQLVNTAVGGWPDETLSSRAWRLHLAGNPLPANIIDGLFFWQDDHCYQSYVSERLGRQLPPELRRE